VLCVRCVPAARCASPHALRAARRVPLRLGVLRAPVTCSKFRHMRLAGSRQCVMDHPRRIAHVATPTPTSGVRYPIFAQPRSPIGKLTEALHQEVGWLAALADGAEDEADYPAVAVVGQRSLRRSYVGMTNQSLPPSPDLATRLRIARP
jgi:hypothetical protein